MVQWLVVYAQRSRCSETLCALASREAFLLHKELIQTQIAQSMNIVISLSSKHKIMGIAEVQLAEEGDVKIQDILDY